MRPMTSLTVLMVTEDQPGAWRRKAAHAIARPDRPYPIPDEGTKVVAT